MGDEEKKCTCDAPLGAAHNPGCPALTIWTPPTPLEENVKRMAWLLFLEAWKVWVPNALTKGNPSRAKFYAETTYKTCLETAKTVRRIELQGDKVGEPDLS